MLLPGWSVCGKSNYGMIMPLALLADISCRNARKYLLGETDQLLADCFPQKDNARRRVFRGAKLSTVVISAKKSRHPLDDASITVKTYPWSSFDDQHKRCKVDYPDTLLLDPKNTPIPLLDEDSWTLCKRVHRAPGVRRLGDCAEVIVRRGEINQTVYRDYIGEDARQSRLVKGVEIGRYVQHVKLSQGTREWFDERRFLRDHNAKEVVHQRRIATQRITGVDEKLRVVATIIDPKAYFADSTNSVHLAQEAPYALEYVLGILNSKLTQWRFKLTSTNNNVGTNELESLPFRAIDFDDGADQSRHHAVVAQVQRVFSLQQSLSGAGTPQARTSTQRKIQACLGVVDDLVFDLYGLSDDDRGLISETERY